MAVIGSLWVPAALVHPDPPAAPSRVPLFQTTESPSVTTTTRWCSYVRAKGGAQATTLRGLSDAGRRPQPIGPVQPGVSSVGGVPIPHGTLLFLDAWTYGPPVPGYSSGNLDSRWYRLTSMPFLLESPSLVMAALDYPFRSDTVCTQAFGGEWDGGPGKYAGKFHPGEDWALSRDGLDVRAAGTSLLRASYAGGTGYIWLLEHSSYSLSGKKLLTQLHHMASAGPVGTIYDRGAWIGRTLPSSATFPAHLHWAMRVMDANAGNSTTLSAFESRHVNTVGYYDRQADMAADGYICPSCIVKRGVVCGPDHGGCACPHDCDVCRRRKKK